MPRRSVHQAIWSVAIALFTFLPTATLAKSYALLVGVSDYDDAIGLADLRGPANDVTLLRDVLSARADFDITVLADGVPGADIPTRDAILSAFARLAEQVETGDFVFVHMSGHGTRQPDDNAEESDGLDEVFLPADTGRAPSGTSSIPNAIRDDELGRAVAALRAKGADVWFVLDSCHAGSGLRAGGPDMASRFVDPSVLGVSIDTAPEPATVAPLDVANDDDLPGSYLAFYAAQSSEVAREIEIDADAPSGNGWYGLFTSRLAARLAQDGAISYRQLFQAVLSDLNGPGIPGAARLQTPLWTGNMIDATVFGGGDTIGVRQFGVTGGSLSAGLLHGINTGTVLGLVADATAGAEERIGYAQVTSADARSARLTAVDAACVPDQNALCPSLGEVASTARFARIAAQPIDLTVRLGPPIDLRSGARLPETDPARTALNAAVARINAAGSARFELADSAAEISVGAYDGALWFGQQVAAGDTPIGLRWAGDEAALDAALTRIFNAERVARMLQSVAGGGSLLFGNPVDVVIKHRDTTMEDRPDTVANLGDLQQECVTALNTSIIRDLPPSEVLNQCDQLVVLAKGAVPGQARDVNRVYIDSQFCIETAYQRVEGTTQNAQVGAPLTACADCPDASGGIVQRAGHERLFMVVTEAKDNSEALDLRALLENCVADGPSSTRAAPGGEATRFLETLRTRTATRGNLGSIGISNIWVERFDWQVLPRREAKLREGVSDE